MPVTELSNPRAAIGGNNPPSPLDDARTALADLSAWLGSNPVIASEDQAREAKLHIDRINATMGQIEDAREKEVRPLNEKLAAINAAYKAFHNTDSKKPGALDKLRNELRSRITDYLNKLQIERERIAAEKQRIADEAERLAREAEQHEADAMANAKVGEVVDLGQAVIAADQAFSDLGKAQRDAERAQRDTHVRLAGGFSGRALSMRNTETLVLDSYAQAITAIGPNEKIEAAILSAARDYRKLHHKLPAGVRAVTERKV